MDAYRRAVTDPIVAEVAAQVRAVADNLAGSIRYPTEPEATAVLMCFLAKIRGVPVADGLAAVSDVPLEELVTSRALTYWQSVFDASERHYAWISSLRNFQVQVPRVRPQADGTLGILLSWVHPDQREPLVFATRRPVLGRMAYLLPNDSGEWRVDRIEYPPSASADHGPDDPGSGTHV
jgi:hypothetical protein